MSSGVLRRSFVMSLGLALLTTPAWADRVSGTLTRTFVIVEDTDLIGDVVCDVGGNPCFSFGASNVELRLNGFTITGQANPIAGCAGAVFPNEFGVTTNGHHNVTVRGPGLVQRFRNWGVFVIGGSRNARIEGITASTNCGAGIRVAAAAFDTLVQGNTVVRNGTTSPGFTCGGIWVNGQNSRVRLNQAYGNGYDDPADDFGIGVVDGGNDNVVEENGVSGNTIGIFISAGARGTLIRSNVVVGNPGIQTGNRAPSPEQVDILNNAPAGQTSFERNVCITGTNAPCPVLTPRQQ